MVESTQPRKYNDISECFNTIIDLDCEYNDYLTEPFVKTETERYIIDKVSFEAIIQAYFDK